MAFVPCVTCRRHVLEAEAACPFCGAAHAPTARPVRVVAGRFSRAALFSMGASTLVACTADRGMYGAPPDYADVSTDVGGDASIDSAPDTKAPDTAVPDTAIDATDADAASADTGFAGAYGGPPPDAGGGG